jgi:hypothetical protein
MNLQFCLLHNYSLLELILGVRFVLKETELLCRKYVRTFRSLLLTLICQVFPSTSKVQRVHAVNTRGQKE